MQLGSRREKWGAFIPQGSGDEAQVEMFWRDVVLIPKLTLDGAGTRETSRGKVDRRVRACAKEKDPSAHGRGQVEPLGQ